MRYSAQMYMHGSSGQWLTPVYSRISDIGKYLRQCFDRNMFDHHQESAVKEIVVLKARRGQMPVIHGYYTLKGDRLILDSSKPASLHNAFYGLGE